MPLTGHPPRLRPGTSVDLLSILADHSGGAAASLPVSWPAVALVAVAMLTGRAIPTDQQGSGGTTGLAAPPGAGPSPATVGAPG